jgi:hypothetical protein
MEYVAHTETDNGYRLKIIADDDASNPRTEWDNGSVMVCEHRSYNLGDYKDGRDKALEAIGASRDYRPSWDEKYDFSNPGDVWAAIKACSDIVAFPLYLFDHSGITIRMSSGGNPFHCPWDSGMVGFIFMTKAMILENWMLPATSRLTPALREKARDLMKAETETYDMYLTGDVYGYVVERLEAPDPDDEDADLDDDRDGEEVDSCWGMFGLDYAIEEGRGVLKHYASIEPPLPLELEPAHA